MIHSKPGSGRNLVRFSVASILGTAALGGSCALAAEQSRNEASKEEILQEVQVTGSRIVRKDMSSNSPLVTVDRQQLEDSTFISVEEALNDLPQFMVGGAGMNAGAVTSLQGANGLDGGRGSGDMFNSTLLPDNAGVIGVVVPGAANVNLRGLGANRSLTLIDGHRGMPINASGTPDLNTIPSIAIANIEVITGGASAVYGADALAGVTNIKFRDNFEGIKLQVRGGLNEVGDGGEYQVAGLMGAKIADGRGSAMIGIEYSKREVTYWKNRDFFREVMESPYSSSGDYAFNWEPGYTSGASTTLGTFNTFQKAWNGNTPSAAAINAVFGNRNCRDAGGALLNCIANTANAPFGGGWYVNPDGTLYTRSSQTGTGASALYFGPQNYKAALGGTVDNPSEISCNFAAPSVSGRAGGTGPFAGEPCNPTSNRVDNGRWLSGPRDAYSLFGRATYDITDSLSVFANFNFASSNTVTRREPAPFSGGFGVVIPFHTSQGGDAVYLPSLVQTPRTGLPVGATLPEFRVGGARGTNCAPTGGCTMAQAFPTPGDVLAANGTVTTAGGLRRLLESRANTATVAGTGVNATNPFRTLSACNVYTLATAGAVGARQNPTGGAYYQTQLDPNTGQPLATCGPNSGWLLNTQLGFLPPRGTENTGRLFQFATGLRGELGFSDWTWEAYTSYGDSETQTNFVGFSSLANYMKIMSAPNYGKGFTEVGVASKYLTCDSGLNPFDTNLVVTQDCIDAITSNEIDRNSMTQRIHELSLQGGLFELPAGQVRSAVGASYRKSAFEFRPDSLRERDYVNDTSAGAFASGDIDARVSVKEVYGELLVPILKDLPLIRRFELELGARKSKYSTGQNVDTYKILGSWEPVQWLRARGGYNRAERAPNIAELFATPSGSAQFSSAPSDPCRNDPAILNVITFVNLPSNQPATNAATRAKLQALCAAHIDAWGGNGASEFHADPNNYNTPGGAALVVGNPGLKNERGDTWTMGLAFSSPFGSPLLSRISGTIDWYEARVSDPIEVLTTGSIVNTCYNINGQNPDYTLNDPNGFCSLIERDPTNGSIVRVYNRYDNLDKLVIRGLDVSLRWNAAMADMGLASVPGSLSLSISGNYLMDQIQRYIGSADRVGDYAGFGGASRIRTSTGMAYNWGAGNRVAVTWQYRLGTHTATTFRATPSADGQFMPVIQNNPIMAGYPTSNQFNGTFGTRIGPVNASVSVNNLLNKKPRPGGYDLRDPRQGFGNFSPFDDLVGRRYSINLTADF
jgi:outer membrane receptor protein involved in Fe transport